MSSPYDLLSAYDEEYVAVKQATSQGYILCEWGEQQTYLTRQASCAEEEFKGKVRFAPHCQQVADAAYIGLRKLTKTKMNENIETNIPIMIGKIPGTNWLDIMQRVYSPKGISPTIHTCGGGRGN